MMQKNLNNFFKNFLKRDSIFIDKKYLQSNYTPGNILHRNNQIQQIANILAPCLRLEKPSNVFIYGKTGTGKTLTINYTANEILKVSKEKEIPIKTIYVNCKLKKLADTEYRLIAQLIRELGKEVPPTGLPTEEVYKIFFNIIDTKKQLLILILDEIDQLVKKAGDEILYNLTRINSELKNAQISIIGISNDLTFADNLDPRVKSSLSEEEIVFPPYNAMQILSILKSRAKGAFKKEAVQQGVLEKCAAYAAREHGDARRALELLRVAGELTERNGEKTIVIKYIDEAEDKIEKDRVLDLVITQPKQHQATLYSIISTKDTHVTGDIYETYKEVCLKSGLRPLTQRRISDIIAEFDMLGLINAKVVSKGRYGRTKEIELAIPRPTHPRVKKILEEGLDLS